MAEKIGILPMWTLEESVQDLIAHGDLDPNVLARMIIRERGAEPLADSFDAAEKEALARALLSKMDDDVVQRLLEERPKRRPRKRTSR